MGLMGLGSCRFELVKFEDVSHLILGFVGVGEFRVFKT